MFLNANKSQNVKMLGALAGGVLALMGATVQVDRAAAVQSESVGQRTTVNAVAFTVDRPGATLGLASVPISAVFDPVEAGGGLLATGGGRALLTADPGHALGGNVSVSQAVERPPVEALAAFRGRGLTRVNYRSMAEFAGIEYRVVVLQPSAEDATRGIEVPGEPGTAGSVQVYNAYSRPGTSWATSVVDRGAVITVAGGTDPEARIHVARAIGLVG